MQADRDLSKHRRAIRILEIPTPALDDMTDEWVVVADQISAKRIQTAPERLTEPIQVVHRRSRLIIRNGQLCTQLCREWMLSPRDQRITQPAPKGGCTRWWLGLPRNEIHRLAWVVDPVAANPPKNSLTP